MQGATELARTDITLLAIQSRAWAGNLFRACSRGDKDVKTAYNNFIEIFWQLYMAFKHNVNNTAKIREWAEHEESYDKAFALILQGRVMPVMVLRLFDDFMGDAVACGIYDLSAGEYQELSG